MTQFISTTASKISLAVTFTVLAFALTASAKADEYDRIDRFAQKIQKKSRLLIKETIHYRHTPQYRALVDASTYLYDAASHVHQVAHFANNLDHLQADLADLDRHFHQLEGLFEATKDSASRGHGRVHNTGYAKGLLRSIEVSIDLMRRDVRKVQSKFASTHHHEVHHPVVKVPHRNQNAYSHNKSHRRAQAIVEPRVVKPVVHSAVPQYGPAYPQRRQASGFSISIGGGRINLNF